MRSIIFMASVIAIFSLLTTNLHGDSRSSYVFQVRMPNEDAELTYIEGADHFRVGIEAGKAMVEGVRFYIGDGRVAVEIEAAPASGIRFQGMILKNGHLLKKGSTIKVTGEYKKASDLPKGVMYVILPGVKFEVPK